MCTFLLLFVCRGLCGRPLHPFAPPSVGVGFSCKYIFSYSYNAHNLYKECTRRVPRGDGQAPWKELSLISCKEVESLQLAFFVYSRGLSGRPLHPFAPPSVGVGFSCKYIFSYSYNAHNLYKECTRRVPRGDGQAPWKELSLISCKEVESLQLVCFAASRGLDRRSATSIVASYACSFRLRRFASPVEKRSRLWRPVNSNQRFEYDRLVRGRNSRHWRESAHLPLDPFGALPINN